MTQDKGDGLPMPHKKDEGSEPLALYVRPVSDAGVYNALTLHSRCHTSPSPSRSRPWRETA